MNTFCDASEEIWSWIAAVGREVGGEGIYIGITVYGIQLLYTSLALLHPTLHCLEESEHAHQNHW